MYNTNRNDEMQGFRLTEKQIYFIIYSFSALLVVVAMYLSVTVETTAVLDACAGCLNMAAGLSN